jgi:DNA (cytosine-5)-methyltransferase 1
MSDTMSLFDLLPEEEAQYFKKQKSTDWKWTMANDYPKEKNGLKVFSCFACGGGSTMGYKLAGCEVLGCVEIDPKMNEVYIKNHNPKHNFLMDIRKFNKIPNEKLPEELFNLDILDGSPPCTTFSMAGEREESWGKKKKFREGQAEQTLDDLSFVFIETVAKLRPKVMIMENVEGLIKGEAWSYVQRIYQQLNDIGYQVKHWLCKAHLMGVPQRRNRVFFIALREDVDYDLWDLDIPR